MNLLYVGSGFVGACSAAVMADSGHNVLVYDIDKNKIEMLGSGDREQIESCLFEEGLSDLLIRNKQNINFTTDYSKLEEFIETCDSVFMCLPTPEIGDTGESDLSYYFNAAENLSKTLIKRNSGRQNNYVVIINKSTVPIEMVNKTQEIMDKAGVKNYGVVSNPEFLVEGKAIQGSLKPDRIVVGAWNQKDFDVMREVYGRFVNSPTTDYIEVNPKEAAAGKLLANYYLFCKLAICYDVIGRTSEKFPDLKFENLRKIISGDPRLGSWGMFDSFFAGGSCFIKDAASLAHQLEKQGADASFVKEVSRVNNDQRDNFYERAKKEAGFDFKNKVISVLGVAFKRDTNDVRNSGAIEIVKKIIDDGVAEIKIYDPAAMPMFQSVFNTSKDARYNVIKYFNSEKESLVGTDACMVLTDWPKFRTVADLIKQECPAPYLIMDGRRMLAAQFDELQNLGYDIIAVGSPFLKGK